MSKKGTLDTETILENLSDAEVGDPAGYLYESLEELMFFASFAADTVIGDETEESVKGCLETIRIIEAKAKDKPHKLFDEKGLFLLVHPKGGKWWRLKYRFGGKEKLLALGTYPEVSLKKARKRRDDARGCVG